MNLLRDRKKGDFYDAHDEWLLKLWNSPERNAIMAAGGWAAYYNGLAAQTVAFAAQVPVGFIMALPVIAMGAVLTALGAPYAQAREAVRSENFQSGFSQGFVMGLLEWQWRHAVDRFGRFSVLRIHHMDKALDKIRVNAYNGGLKTGYAAALDANAKKAYLEKIRKFTSGARGGSWSRNEQISYVIEGATAALRNV